MALLFDSALKATIILAVAWVAARCSERGTADLRHRIWMAATVAVLLLPLWLLLTPSDLPAALRIDVQSQAVAKGSDAALAIPGLRAAWALGMLLVLGRLALGLWQVARLTRNSRVIGGVLYSDQIMTPMTWGLLNPLVLLPVYAIEWSDEQRDLVLRHEHAHILRHDWLWQMLAQLACALFWFHPLMWLAFAELRREGEDAADDRVLADGVSAANYAGQLLAVARRITGTQPVGMVAMVRRPTLEKRISGILDATRPRRPAGFQARAAIATAALGLTFACAVLDRGRVYKIGEDGVSTPKVVQKSEPQYTEQARAAKTQGTVVLHLEVDSHGRARNIQVTRGIDPGLDANAIKAIGMWRFDPARKNGKPVAAHATIEVNFHLL
jgi:TonB family protein